MKWNNSLLLLGVVLLGTCSCLEPLITKASTGSTGLAAKGSLQASCTLEQPHITLGDAFGTVLPGQNRWTVVAVSKDDCKLSSVSLILSDGSTVAPSFKNTYSNAEKSYDAQAFFWQIPHNTKATSWKLVATSNTLGPYPFPASNPQSSFVPSKWILIADMDDSNYSAPTINRLKKMASEGWDGVIHNGDFAYNIHTSKGKVGDAYFKTFSQVSSLIPFVVTPGNHEYFDSFRMFNYRFQMPGGGNGLASTKASNYYSFVYKGVYFVTINWDYVFQDGQNNLREVLAWFQNDLQTVAKNPEVRFRVFFSHKPFYATFADEDTVNFYLYKPIESLLYKFNFDVVLSSHIHLYYRNKKLDKNMQIVHDSDSAPLMVISGHQGVDPDKGGNKDQVSDKRKGVLEVTALAGVPNIFTFEVSATGIRFTLRECDSFKVLDSFFAPAKSALYQRAQEEQLQSS